MKYKGKRGKIVQLSFPYIYIYIYILDIFEIKNQRHFRWLSFVFSLENIGRVQDKPSFRINSPKDPAYRKTKITIINFG